MKKAAEVVSTAMPELTTKTEAPTAYDPRFAEWLHYETFNEPELNKVVAACNEWANAFKSKKQPRWLSLIGSSGTGKTHCAKKLFNFAARLSDWTECTYVHQPIYWPDFVQNLRAGTAFGLRDDMKEWPVLLLDDIGSERDTSGFATEELNTLLGCRMGKWTVITSNLNIDSIKGLDWRIASRLIRDKNICVGIDAKDFAER